MNGRKRRKLRSKRSQEEGGRCLEGSGGKTEEEHRGSTGGQTIDGGIEKATQKARVGTRNCSVGGA